MITTRTLVALVALVLLFAACGGDGDDGAEDESAGSETSAEEDAGGSCYEEPTTVEGGVIIEDVECGGGPEAERGALVSVHYTGTLEDGTKFDSSRDRNQPYRLNLGAGMVIEGWDIGVLGMKVGGVRTLTIPPELGYGEAGSTGVIPPNATLIFEIELLDVKAAP